MENELLESKALAIYEKRTITRLIGPNKAVKMKASAIEVIAHPIGVSASDVLHAQSVMIWHIFEKQEALDQLLKDMLTVPDAKGNDDGSEQ